MIAWLRKQLDHDTAAVRYFVGRLFEKSTLAGLGAVVTGGSALDKPYSWLFIGAGVLAMIVPTTKRDA